MLPEFGTDRIYHLEITEHIFIDYSLCSKNKKEIKSDMIPRLYTVETQVTYVKTLIKQTGSNIKDITRHLDIENRKYSPNVQRRNGEEGIICDGYLLLERIQACKTAVGSAMV